MTPLPPARPPAAPGQAPRGLQRSGSRGCDRLSGARAGGDTQGVAGGRGCRRRQLVIRVDSNSDSKRRRAGVSRQPDDRLRIGCPPVRAPVLLIPTLHRRLLESQEEPLGFTAGVADHTVELTWRSESGNRERALKRLTAPLRPVEPYGDVREDHFRVKPPSTLGHPDNNLVGRHIPKYTAGV